MRLPRFLPLAVIGCALAASFAHGANAVLDWNERMIDAVRLGRNPPPVAALHMATFHAAIFDAVNGITRTHRGWLVNETAPPGIDTDAAIAGAANAVLIALWSQSANPHNLRAAYDRALASIPEGPAKTDGLAWGKHVAELILANRARSGYDKPVPGEYASTEPGKWRETPPGFRPPVLPHIAKVTPFAMTAPDQFRAPPPPSFDSPQSAEELAQIVRIGARDGAERTEYQTLSAPFWSDDLGTCTPPGHWNVIAGDLARRRNLSVPETARLFALLNFAEADAGIACWDTKFFYRTWRPETALREPDPKLNAPAKPAPGFIPLMVSPAFPSYTSGHSTFSAAGSRILEKFLGGDDVEFVARSDGLPGAVRTYQKLSECREEIGMSRLWAGIHVMSDNLEGQKCGIKIADWIFAHALVPLEKSAATAAP
ncbi:MAG: vanadium-dependent haloperoxidase [Opitutaceae bacterium]